MPSQLSIANHCLDLLGETSITDINASVERAERILAAWDDTRDAALRARSWRFSIARRSWAKDVAAPAWGFDNQFTIDGDVVRVLQVDEYYPAAVLSDFNNSDSAEFRIEGSKILTSLGSPLKVKVIVNSIDVGAWDACFARVMACDLADRLSTRITGSENIKARIKSERRDALSEARHANALEDPPTQIADSSWMASRFSV